MANYISRHSINTRSSNNIKTSGVSSGNISSTAIQKDACPYTNKLIINTEKQVYTSNNMRITLNQSRNNLLTPFAIATLKDRYMMPNEGPQDMFARVSTAFADNSDHAQRIYEYISQLWFLPATPILSNAGLKARGMPISCFLNECQDTLPSISELFSENISLASKGGGIGSYFGNVRSMGEEVGPSGKSSGIIPFLKIVDSITLGISQGGLRRGSGAIYLPIHHPEISEFIDIRKASGGDINRRCLNLNHGVVLTDEFMRAVENGTDFNLISPRSGKVVETVKARYLWEKILSVRIETGEPYILFIDNVNKSIPQHHKNLGLTVKMSNLCSEITLPTGIDHLGKERTAVCCLSSLNLEYFETWSKVEGFVEDIMRFLDNVLQYFIENAPDSMAKAKYSAYRERSIGLGVMGFHSFLQKKMIPISGLLATSWNRRIFQHIDHQVNEASKILAEERGPCPDARDGGAMERFSNKTAVAPTASISSLANTSPSIEPIYSGVYTHKTLSGNFEVRNPFLDQLVKDKAQGDKDLYDSIWSEIKAAEGSIQSVSCFSQEEKEVFKTAFEIDQLCLIKLAADRTPYISQAQSLNIFLKNDIDKLTLHAVHFAAWKLGVKSLYYCRSTAARRPDNVSSAAALRLINSMNDTDNKYAECESCQ